MIRDDPLHKDLLLFFYKGGAFISNFLNTHLEKYPQYTYHELYGKVRDRIWWLRKRGFIGKLKKEKFGSPQKYKFNNCSICYLKYLGWIN